MATFKEQQDDDAPLEVSLNTLKQQVNKRTEIEKSHQKRHKKNAKKRKRGWAKSQANKLMEKGRKEFDESMFRDDDFKEDDQKPNTKKRRLNKWMEESDLFHHIDNNDNDDKEKQIDDTEIEEKNDADIEEEEKDKEDDDEDNDDDDDEVPQEVIELFEKAMAESSSQKEFEDKWKKIIEEQSEKYAHLKHKFDKFDKLFVDGFQIEVNGVYRLNLSAMKRSLRMKHFVSKKHHRIAFNKKMSYGSMKPSFGFVKGSVNRKYDLKNKKFKPSSFWGEKIVHTTKLTKQEQLQKWLDY